MKWALATELIFFLFFLFVFFTMTLVFSCSLKWQRLLCRKLMELLIPTSEANITRLAVETSGYPLVSICGTAVTERIKVPPNNSAIKVSKKQKKKRPFVR